MKIRFEPVQYIESTEPIPSPYQGLYRMYRYMLNDSPCVEQQYLSDIDSNPYTLALLEINLKNYRKTEISLSALHQCETIIKAWFHSDKKLIIRFLYDWDGIACYCEPGNINTILNHMTQLSPIINAYDRAVYLLQGIFIGNWGEMHHSNYMDDKSVITLINKLHSTVHPSIYLSVRTPQHWRMITKEIPELKKRLGLYNDGMLGSESDLGTYTNREEELIFQHNNMQYLPNGGEVIYNMHYNSIQTFVQSLKTMHVSYLNADYDTRVYDIWKNSTYNNQNGYDYIVSHLGYHYAINNCAVTKPFLKNEIRIQCTIQNNGFSNALQSHVLCISLQNNDSIITYQSECDIPCDAEKTISTIIPTKELNENEYQVYACIKDQMNNTMIPINNTGYDNLHGVFLGTLYIHH